MNWVVIFKKKDWQCLIDIHSTIKKERQNEKKLHVHREGHMKGVMV